MAIKKEFYKTREDGVNLFRTYSDAGLMIRKVGTDEVYSEAIDIEGSGYTYEETGTAIDEDVVDPEKATEQDLLAALAELGVTDEEENT
jgi:hypothetical protein